MASKYDTFWNNVFEENGGEEVFKTLQEKGSAVLTIKDISSVGNRGHWYGSDKFDSTGKVGTGINAHVTALKRVIPQGLPVGLIVKATVSVKGDKLTLTKV